MRRRNTRAFTLIEVMLAIGIMGGLMVAIYASWSAIVRSSQIGIDAAVDAGFSSVKVNGGLFSLPGELPAMPAAMPRKTAARKGSGEVFRYVARANDGAASGFGDQGATCCH